jgi:hypothetical protein
MLIHAWTVVRKKGSYYQAHFQRLRQRRGPKEAICAVAASMLTAIYHMLRDGTAFKDSAQTTSTVHQRFRRSVSPSKSPSSASPAQSLQHSKQKQFLFSQVASSVHLRLSRSSALAVTRRLAHDRDFRGLSGRAQGHVFALSGGLNRMATKAGI